MSNKPPIYIVILNDKKIHSIHRDKKIAEQWKSCKEYEGDCGSVSVIEMSGDMVDDLRSLLESEQ